MANINKELNDIKNAKYGRDVRGAIHDGIDKINKESEESKQKASEAHDVMESILDESFDSSLLESNFEQKLDDKIGQLQPEWTQFKNDTQQNFNQVTSQLNETANKDEVEELRANKITKGSGTLDDFDETTRAMLLGLSEGETQINAVLGVQNVQPINTDFIRRGRNMFNPSDVQFYKTIDTNGNIIDSSTEWTLAGKVYLTGENDIVFSYLNTSGSYAEYAPNIIAFYDSLGNFISRQTSVSKTSVPQNASYFYFVLTGSFSNNELYKRVMVESGTQISTFEHFNLYLTGTIEAKKVPELRDNSIDPRKVNFLKRGRNMFNPNEVQFYKSISSSGEIIESAEQYVLSGITFLSGESDLVFSYVTKSGSYIVYSPAAIAFYTRDGEFLKRETGMSTVEVPSGAGYFLFVLPPSFATDEAYKRVMVEKGTSISTFEEFEYKLDSTIKTGSSIDTSQLILKKESIIHTISTVMSAPTQIKMIGNSITQGVGGTGFTNDSANGELIINVPTLDSGSGGRNWYVNTNGHCWANSLRDYLTEKFNATVKNWGTRGVSATWFISHNMLPTLIEDSDDIVIMMIGTNDRSQATNYSTYIYYLKQVIEYITVTRGKKLILLSSIPASIADETEASKKFHMEDVDNANMYMSSLYNLPYISLYKEFLSYCENNGVSIDSLLVDGLHPNDQGYDVMFNIVLKSLGFAPKRIGATW